MGSVFEAFLPYILNLDIFSFMIGFSFAMIIDTFILYPLTTKLYNKLQKKWPTIFK